MVWLGRSFACTHRQNNILLAYWFFCWNNYAQFHKLQILKFRVSVGFTLCKKWFMQNTSQDIKFLNLFAWYSLSHCQHLHCFIISSPRLLTQPWRTNSSVSPNLVHFSSIFPTDQLMLMSVHTKNKWKRCSFSWTNEPRRWNG